MQFEIDARSPVTPSGQLADQVRIAVASGRLRPLDRLPSVRDVAKGARINPNTASRAWRELELSGLLESRRRSGMFVTSGARRIAAAFRTGALCERLGRAVGESLAAGLSPEEIQDLVRKSRRQLP